MYNRFDLLIDSYAETKVGIDSGFISEELSTGLFQNIINLQKDNLMVEAGIGNKPVADTQQQMRGDTIYWMDKSHDNIFEQEFLQHTEDFIKHLNRTCYTGINGYEFHYAVYANGASYKRHKDQFKNDSNRKFSMIHYLNKDWVEKDGGHLLIYKDEEVLQISPKSQTAVFFKSDELEHEVLDSHKPRMSITGWLKRI